MAKVVENQIVKISKPALKRGVVILDLKKYEELKKKVVGIPVYQLKGKAAKELDKLVREGLREYERGETIKAPSLKEALRIYGGKKNKKY